jgi:hypothetical protein
MTRILPIFIGITLFFTNCSSNVDQTLLGDLTSAGTELEDLIGQTSTIGENLAKFQTVLDAAPETLKSDTAANFGGFKENFNEIKGRHDAVNSQLNDMKIRLVVMMQDYQSGKIKTDVVKSEFENFSKYLVGVSETIGTFTKSYREVQTDYGKMMANFNMKKEEIEAEMVPISIQK